MPGTPVGSLACQLNTSLRTLASKVISCVKVDAPPPPKGASTRTKDKDKDAAPVATAGEAAPSAFYEIICEDSVLFPEGGGQPCDLGTLNKTIPVIGVVRRGDTCVIKAEAPVPEGAEVVQDVDWSRREDHMQHHSGQHLLTAVMESMLGHPTDSWALSTPTCYLQLPIATIPQPDIDRVEDACNALIRQGKPVVTKSFASRADIPEARSRKIPADVSGPIRIVTIDDVDSCTCCGTHVTDLRELQCVKLLHLETKGDMCKLHFIFGNRVLSQFGAMYARERALQKLLGLQPPQFVADLDRRGKESSETQKHEKKLLAEVAELSRPSIAAAAAQTPEGKPFVYLREDADMDFLGVIAAALQDDAFGAPAKQRVCLLACGSLKSTACDGAFMIVGPTAEDIKAFADTKALAGLAGKGGQSKQGFRGKCDMRLWKAFVKTL